MALKPKDRLALALAHAEIVARGPASYAPYAHFAAGYLIGYDGVVAAGARTPETLMFAPHVETLRAAIAKAGEPYSLARTDAGKLAVRSTGFRADVPGFPLEQMPNALPDPPMLTVGTMFRHALIAAGKLASARASRVVEASVFIGRESVMATNGVTIVEARHGETFAGTWLLPVEFVTALERVKIAPTSAGYSDFTFTLWFGQDVWLRTSRYSEEFPDVTAAFSKILMHNPEWRPVPKELTQALETIKPFLADDKLVKISRAGVACMLPTGEAGAAVEFTNHMFDVTLPYSVAYLIAKSAEWVGVTFDAVIWQSATERGAFKL